MRYAAALVVFGLGASLAHAAVYESVIGDSARPVADTVRDVNRRPAEVLAFIDLQPGARIGDYAAGNGYFTRLFAVAVGPAGHIYASVPSPLFQYPNIVKGLGEIQDYIVAHPNVSVSVGAALEAVRYPEALDVFFIAQNYHDLRDPFMGPVDMAAFNQAVFRALKPGAHYIVLDHVAAAGAPADVSDTLHRIEASTVRREVLAAGFRLEAESPLLANPGDPHTRGVFDASIRGRTDQFLLKFVRPR